MTKPDEPGDRYILSELEVYGRGGSGGDTAGARIAAQTDGTLNLAGGNWRVQRASLVPADGEQLSTAGLWRQGLDDCDGSGNCADQLSQ